jgi:hypothetical protein
MKMFDGHPAGLYCLRHGDVFVRRAWRHPEEHKATTQNSTYVLYVVINVYYDVYILIN